MSLYPYCSVSIPCSRIYLLSSKQDVDVLLLSYVTRLLFLDFIHLILCPSTCLLNSVSPNSSYLIYELYPL